MYSHDLQRRRSISPSKAYVRPTAPLYIYTYVYYISPPAPPSPPPQERERDSSGAARAQDGVPRNRPYPQQLTSYSPPPFDTVIPGRAPEDVEHAVGRRRKAHAEARGGAGAGGGQRRPGVVRRAEAVYVVEVACGGRRGTRTQGRGRRAAGGGRRAVDAEEASRRA
jgi:hypothetical protein